MPMLYALGQHQALHSVQSQLPPDEGLLAFHNDLRRLSMTFLASGITAASRFAGTEADLVGNLEAPPEEWWIKVLGTNLELPPSSSHGFRLRSNTMKNCSLRGFTSCASSWATYHLRVCHPEFTAPFARQHDIQVWECLATLLGHTPPQSSWELASLPMHMGRSGFRSLRGLGTLS